MHDLKICESCADIVEMPDRVKIQICVKDFKFPLFSVKKNMIQNLKKPKKTIVEITILSSNSWKMR